MTTDAKVRAIAEALLRQAREMGCEPTLAAVRAKYGDAGDDVAGDWTIECVSSVGSVCDEYMAALDRGHGLADLDRKYLLPALQLAAELAARPATDPDCPECRGTGWYVGLHDRERCSFGCPGE